jgi:CheY-like chemotaxis protein
MPGTGIQKTVLVVEDEASVRRLLAKSLGAWGFRTIEAGNGREAIAHLARETPAAIVIDLLMPIMSGVELLKALQRNSFFRTIPTVVMTGVVEPRQIAALGVPVVLKPDLAKLPELLAQLIARKNADSVAQLDVAATLTGTEEVVSGG